MAQVNTCLKRVFTIFNVCFAIIGGVIISLGLLCQILTSYQSVQNRTDALVVFYVVGIITMVIAILGAYGAHKESRVSMIIFLVCMVVGSLLMLRVGVPFAAVRPQYKEMMEEKFRTFLPLDQASDEAKNMVNSLQSTMHCCGLFSYTDWESDIPPSCLCDPSEEEQMGACRTIDYRSLFQQKSVYAKPCVPIILHYVLLLLDIVLGVIFSLLALAVLGMILSSIILHQMRYPNRPTVLMTVPTIFTTPPPKYQELHNPPTY
ncbi:CD63 antigen-like [Seriola aureovittata]|uniref:CD63 antigen-like n=1 Tax=Seriola aureovittata TaxID=2871759 RepID=UPI0024BDFFEF|nr:CD63 antigen-like [Seriola aureovittata]